MLQLSLARTLQTSLATSTFLSYAASCSLCARHCEDARYFAARRVPARRARVLIESSCCSPRVAETDCGIVIGLHRLAKEHGCSTAIASPAWPPGQSTCAEDCTET